MSNYESAAMNAISSGKGMGQMLRELPASTPKEELQRYGPADEGGGRHEAL